GSISANGGAGDSRFGGGGGGGRIVIDCPSNTFTGGFSAHGGPGINYGGAGTVYVTTNLNTLGQLVVDNGGFRGADTPVSQFSGSPAPPFGLTVSGDAVAYPSTASAATNFVGLTLSNLTVTSGAEFVGGVDGVDASNPCYTVTLTVIGNAVVDSNSAISVDSQGLNGGAGPGQGSAIDEGYGGGGGYGGAGGASSSGSPGGLTYGSASQPTNWGSGGGLNPIIADFCQGGGAIRLMIAGDLTVNGSLSANGAEALFGGGGGGAGGSAWITARQLDGSGSIRANGGAGYPDFGGGGGGRIAINTLTNNFTGLVTAM